MQSESQNKTASSVISLIQIISRLIMLISQLHINY